MGIATEGASTLCFSVPLFPPFTSQGAASVRPVITFVSEDQSFAGDMQDDVITCEPIDLPVFINYQLIDTFYSMAEITIYMGGDKYPLNLAELEFTIEGTSPHIIPQVRLYSGDNFSTAMFLGSVSMSPGNDTNTFYLTRNLHTILSDGPNKFYIVYDINRPSLFNGISCDDVLSFKLTRFAVERPTSPNLYDNPVVFPNIERELGYDPVDFINIGN